MFSKKLIATSVLLGILFMLVLSACAPAAASTSSDSALAAMPTTQAAVVAQPTPAPVEPAVTATTAIEQTSPTVQNSSQDTAQMEQSVLKLNLNDASADEFLTIPGMGNRMVREFQEYRPYLSILQFRREIGKYVDDAQVAEYEKYVFVPISTNEADIETLQQIPGLDASEAQALIDGRPYTDNEAFLAALAGYISEAELAVARSFLNN